ncbi:glycerol-3-phosphate 1-O-acyltransferase PlsY [bacterium]|nr:glycerol-3-phosphate 1-O-acyltransferase PlsY [bacterium]
MKELFLSIFSFLYGSIPFGFLICKYRLGVDIRKMGSGNIGTTNVMRIAGPITGLIVLILDASKGVIPVLIAKSLAFSPTWVVIVGLLAVCGHIFSPFLRFKGGRGVATGLGLVIGIAPQIALILLLIWGVVVLFTRYVSIASLTSAFAFPILMAFTHQPLPYLLISLIISVLVIIRHKPNIERLLAGKEHKLGEKVKPK